MTTRREFTKTVSIGSVGALFLGAAACAPGEKKTGKRVELRNVLFQEIILP